MQWREALDVAVCETELLSDLDAQYMRTNVAAALLDMPAEARIALARELLAGTGRVVARDVQRPTRPDGLSDDAWEWAKMGCFLHRAAMMGDE